MKKNRPLNSFIKEIFIFPAASSTCFSAMSLAAGKPASRFLISDGMAFADCCDEKIPSIWDDAEDTFIDASDMDVEEFDRDLPDRSQKESEVIDWNDEDKHLSRKTYGIHGCNGTNMCLCDLAHHLYYILQNPNIGVNFETFADLLPIVRKIAIKKGNVGTTSFVTRIMRLQNRYLSNKIQGPKALRIKY